MSFLGEAFRQLNLLEEEDFSLDSKGLSDAKNFIDDDNAIEDALNVIDPEVDDIEEVKDSYVGDVICQCEVCKSLVYKKPEDLDVDDDLAVDSQEECPYCFNVGSLIVIGKVEPIESVEDIEAEDEAEVKDFDDIEDTTEEDTDVADIDAEDDETAVEVEDSESEDEEDKDIVEESLNEEVIKESAWDKVKAFLNAEDDMEESLEECNDSITESFEEVSIKTEDQEMSMTQDPETGKITVETQPVVEEDIEDVEDFAGVEIEDTVNEPVEAEEEEGEMIVPLDDYDDAEAEIEDEISAGEASEEESEEDDEMDIDIDEIDEESFDELGESYLKNVYDNVKSYKTSNVTYDGSKLVFEGVIEFNSGNKKSTQFAFTADTTDGNGKARFLGENLQLTRGKKSFAVKGTIQNSKFISESFRYNYTSKDGEGKSVRLYGTVRR